MTSTDPGARGEVVLFRTARLHVRRLHAGDLEDLCAVYGDAVGQRFVADGQPLDREGCERWIEVTRRNVARRGYGMSVIVDSSTEAVLGFIGVVHPGGQPEPELKYALRRAAWGRGVATEAAAGMLAYAARAFGQRRVVATIHPDNTASLRVMEKCGAERIATLRDPDGGGTALCVWRAPSCVV